MKIRPHFRSDVVVARRDPRGNERAREVLGHGGMQARRALVALVFVSFGSTGCYASHERGSDTGSSARTDASPGATTDAIADAGPAPVTPDDFVERIVRAWCEELSACPTLAGGERIARADVELCVELSPTAIALREALGRYADAVDDGITGFDPAAIPGCLDEIARTDCVSRGDLLARPPPHPFSIGEPGLVGSGPRCDAVFPRRLALAEGEVCEGPLDCALGLHCAATRGATECVRRCEPLAEGGEPCEGGALCAGAGGDLLCEDGRCVPSTPTPDASEGELCGWLSEPTRDQRCHEGLACLGGRCTAIEERPGAPCPVRLIVPAGEGCGAGLRCIAVDGAGARCLPSELQEDVGAWCSLSASSEALLVCDPRARLVCDDDERRCRRMSNGGAGERCDVTLYETCQRGLRCVDGHCAEAGEAGEPCAGPWECQSSWCADGVCQACDADAAAVFYAR